MTEERVSKKARYNRENGAEISEYSSISFDLSISNSDAVSDNDITKLIEQTIVKDNINNDVFKETLEWMFDGDKKEEKKEDDFLSIWLVTATDLDIQFKFPEYFDYDKENAVEIISYDQHLDNVSLKMVVAYYEKGTIPKTTEEKNVTVYTGFQEHDVKIKKTNTDDVVNVLQLHIDVIHKMGDSLHHEMIYILMEERKGRFPFLHEVTHQPVSHKMHWVEDSTEETIEDILQTCSNKK